MRDRLAVRALALSLLILASGALCAQKVKVEYDHGADFSKFKTYAWTDGTPAVNPVWDQLIMATIGSELEARGLRRVEAKDADLLVAYHVAGDLSLNVALSFHPVSVYPADGTPLTGVVWYSGTTGGTARYIKKGMLAVHLFDREKHSLVWAATAKDPVKETPQKRVEQLNKVADKLFADFPPKPKP